jgi:hypothetical protein
MVSQEGLAAVELVKLVYRFVVLSFHLAGAEGAVMAY